MESLRSMNVVDIGNIHTKYLQDKEYQCWLHP